MSKPIRINSVLESEDTANKLTQGTITKNLILTNTNVLYGVDENQIDAENKRTLNMVYGAVGSTLLCFGIALGNGVGCLDFNRSITATGALLGATSIGIWRIMGRKWARRHIIKILKKSLQQVEIEEGRLILLDLMVKAPEVEPRHTESEMKQALKEQHPDVRAKVLYAVSVYHGARRFIETLEIDPQS